MKKLQMLGDVHSGFTTASACCVVETCRREAEQEERIRPGRFSCSLVRH